MDNFYWFLRLKPSKRILAMEVIGEDLQVQVFASSHNATNQETSLLNEDVAIATEVVTEKPELIEIEKELVIQKRFIMKEKILLPKKVMTFPLNHSLGEHSSLFTVGIDGLFEVSHHDCEESTKMEIASQESTDSRMDISSQESCLSQMEYSSQEADILINPISNDCIQSKEKDVREATCEAKPFKGNSIPVNEAEVLSTEGSSYEKCSWHENDPQISNGSVVNGEEEEVLKENRFQGEVFEANSEAKSGVLKRKAGILADEMRLRIDKCLLSREKAVAAREIACLSREKAIKEREAALVSQGSSFLMATANDSPLSKRLKSIDVFEHI